jgi:hypothetical protein
VLVAITLQKRCKTLDDKQPKQPKAGLILPVTRMGRYLKQGRYSERFLKERQSSWQQSSNTSNAKSLNLQATLLSMMEEKQLHQDT